MTAARFANGVLGGSALLWLATVGFFVVRHGWTPQYVVVGLAGLLLTLALHLRPSWKINLAVLLLSTAFAAYMAELLVAFVFTTAGVAAPTHWLTWASVRDEAVQRAALAKASARSFDMRSREEVMTDLLRQGVAAVPSIPVSPVLLREEPSGVLSPRITVDGRPTLPFGGISNKTTILCNESGEYVFYESDQFGFHNPSRIWDGGPVRVGIVGDSYAQGFCVPSDQNFAAIIRKTVPGTVNLGMAGNGPLSDLGGIREYFADPAPQVVLWFFYEGNDLSDLAWERRSPLLMSYLGESFMQGLKRDRERVDEALINHVQAVRQSLKPMERFFQLWNGQDFDRDLPGELERLVKLAHLRERVQAAAGLTFQESGAQKQRPRPASVEQMALFRKVLQVAQASVRAQGGELVMVYLPQWERYADPAFASPDRTEVLDLVGSLKIPLVDMHPVFASHSDPLELFPFRRRGHYNSTGHRLVAEAVLRFIRMHYGNLVSA